MSAVRDRGRKPIVLLPPDIRVDATKRGPLPVFVVQRPYVDAIVEAGGVPVIVPALADETMLDDIADLGHALVLPGGAFDIDPALYGEQKLPECGEIKPERTNLERALLSRAVQRNLPVLGVCGGMQLMNVERGGTLWQDLASQRGDDVGHQQAGPKHESAHRVMVESGTKLASLVGTADPTAGELPVNSTHHQAVKTLGRGLIASAHATDGLVEALEDPTLPFFVGVQWHPESMREAPHRAIYRGLMDAARARIKLASD